MNECVELARKWDEQTKRMLDKVERISRDVQRILDILERGK